MCVSLVTVASIPFSSWSFLRWSIQGPFQIDTARESYSVETALHFYFEWRLRTNKLHDLKLFDFV